MKVTSPESMIAAIRAMGIVPLFKSGVAGWSIEDMTPPEWWFYSSDNLGPWDWKVDAVREGDIAYGKFLGGKAAFATVGFYRDLMNWRRSLPKYRVALGERSKATTNSEKLMKILSPLALGSIKEAGAMGAKELRLSCSEKITPAQVRSMGAHYKPLLSPTIKKNVMDSVMQFLQMGTWTVIGDIEREYRGPNLEYSGWQLASNTTPDALFGGFLESSGSDGPSWAKRFDEPAKGSLEIAATPEESRMRLINHVREMFPDAEEKALLKII